MITMFIAKFADEISLAFSLVTVSAPCAFLPVFRVSENVLLRGKYVISAFVTSPLFLANQLLVGVAI